jgi:hypothetical protein
LFVSKKLYTLWSPFQDKLQEEKEAGNASFVVQASAPATSVTVEIEE